MKTIIISNIETEEDDSKIIEHVKRAIKNWLPDNFQKYKDIKVEVKDD